MDLEYYGASSRRVVPSPRGWHQPRPPPPGGNQPHRGMPFFGVRRRTVGLAAPRSGDGSRERKAEFSWAGGLPLRAGKSAMASYGHHRSRTMMITSAAILHGLGFAEGGCHRAAIQMVAAHHDGLLDYSLFHQVVHRQSKFCALAIPKPTDAAWQSRSEEHTSELQSLRHLVCRL